MGTGLIGPYGFLLLISPSLFLVQGAHLRTIRDGMRSLFEASD